VVVRANTAVGEKPGGRTPLSSSHGQVAEDLKRLREMEVDEVFFET
jgi:hypothetical protein